MFKRRRTARGATASAIAQAGAAANDKSEMGCEEVEKEGAEGKKAEQQQQRQHQQQGQIRGKKRTAAAGAVASKDGKVFVRPYINLLVRLIERGYQVTRKLCLRLSCMHGHVRRRQHLCAFWGSQQHA